MIRLTKKLYNENVLIDGKPMPYYTQDCGMVLPLIYKLGIIEDFEEQLGINILELLQDFKKQQDDFGKITKDVDVDYLAHTVLNGISYRILNEELGCPLDVVFKALEYGIEFEHNVLHTKLISSSIRLFYFQNKWIIRASALTGNSCNAYDRFLKDYQKTWWLKGEK